jgi:hypothetical protein
MLLPPVTGPPHEPDRDERGGCHPRPRLIDAVKGVRTNQGIAEVVSIILALPFALMISLLLLRIEPPFARLISAAPDQPNIFGSAVVFGALALSVVALAVNVAPIMRDVRAGTAADPVNIALTVLIGFFILLFIGALIVDQYPCWIGMPNCD